MIDFTALASLMAIIVSLGTLFIAWRRAPHETRSMDAESETKVSEAALKLLEPLQKRIDELEAARERDKGRISEHERRITELECELREERNAKAEIIDGAMRLAHQVESMGGKPVYMPPKRGTGELRSN